MDTFEDKIAPDIMDALDRTAQSIFYVIQDGRFVYGNRKGCRVTGLNSWKDVYGKPALTFVHPDDRPLLAQMTQRTMEGEDVGPFEWRLHTVEGNVAWVMGLLLKIEFKGRPAILGNYIDITRLKQTRLELKNSYKKIENLETALESVRTEERAQIAWELQDNLSYTLNSLKTEMTDLFKDTPENERKKKNLIRRVDSALAAISRISTHLNPVVLSRLDLTSSVRRYLKEFRKSTGTILDFSLPSEELPIGKKQSHAVFDIIRDFLKNIVQAGPFETIDVQLSNEPRHLIVLIHAKGKKGIKKAILHGAEQRIFKKAESKIQKWDGSLDVSLTQKDIILKIIFPVRQKTTEPIKQILLGIGHPILMEGVQQMLSILPHLIISSNFGSFLELRKKIKETPFDLIFVDTHILGENIFSHLKEIKTLAPDMPILVFHSTGDDDDLAVRIFRQGGSGYLSFSSTPEEMVSAVHKVAAGRKHISNRIAEKLAFDVDIYAAKPFHHRLSDRERQVMFMIAEGKTMKEIAEEICLGYKTVVTYRNRVLEKMNMKTNTEIVRYVVTKGLI